MMEMEVKCPTCGKLAAWKDNPTRPFCSERCQLIDFGSWVDEEFRVPLESPWPSEGEDTIPSGQDSESQFPGRD